MNKTKQTSGFSLLEILVAMTVLLIMLAAAATMLSGTQKAWSNVSSRATQFRDARLAFELITRNLSQATLNTYWDYESDSDGEFVDYGRKSELHFYNDKAGEILDDDTHPTNALFFQAILGFSRAQEYQQLNTLLNARGYFIEFAEDNFQRPNFLENLGNQQPRWRYRLMEYMPPTEKNLVYQADLAARDDASKMKEWFSADLIRQYSRPVVDNIVALIVSPQSSPQDNGDSSNVFGIAPTYDYDSRNAGKPDTYNVLPPLVRITLIALDEASAIRLQDENGESPPALVESDYFESAVNYESDLENLEKDLQEKQLNYRIFSTIVTIQSAKWSH